MGKKVKVKTRFKKVIQLIRVARPGQMNQMS